MTNNTILVSIIVPVYNAERYIRKCIESILSQTYTNLELILVDDGSIDSSSNIIDEYSLKDSRIKVVHKKNEGVSSARNSGLDIATGMYVTFADADDEMKSDCVEYLLNLITTNQTNVAYTDKLFTDHHMNQENDNSVQVISGEDAAERIILETYNVGVYCKIFRLEFLNQNKIRFFPNVYIGEGLNFNALAYQYADKVAVGHRKVYYYRTDNANSAMTKFNIKKCEMAVNAIKILQSNLILCSQKLNKACMFDLWNVHKGMFSWMMKAGAQKDYPEIYREYCRYAHRKAYLAFTVPCSLKNKIEALLCMISPKAEPMLIAVKRKIQGRN